MGHRDLMKENAWMFDHQPGADEIEPLLKEVPAWHGADKLEPPVMMDNYIGFVISIKQKIGGVETWRLYTTVAGKIAILHDAHMIDGKPVPVTETEEIDYRNTLVVVKGTMSSAIYGTVCEVGTGVMGEGASGADRTNPIENAKTSWRGRAASALCGAGILPYTGIASAEEVKSAESRQESMDRLGYNTVAPAQEPEKRESKAHHQALESIKKILGWKTASDAEAGIDAYLKSIGSAYEGTATDFVLGQANIDIFQKIMKYHQGK